MGIASILSPAQMPSSAPQSIFDQRIIEVDLELEPGVFTKFTELAIYATGIKFGNANQNQCECRIYNLTREQQSYIIKQSSPLKIPRTLINMNVYVGRESYGKFLLFTGQVISSDITQPPDIGVTLRSLTSNYLQGAISQTQYPASTALNTIAQGIAIKGGWTLHNEAANRNIDNFSYVGTPLNGVDKLNQMGNVNASVDNGVLKIVDSTKSLKAPPVLINEATGMVGIPQVNEQGVLVTCMINPDIQLMGSVTVNSIMNPAANGTFKVIKVNFELANRDQPFWYILETSNLSIYQGTT